MTRRATFTAGEVARLIRGAVAAGWPIGTFAVVAEGGNLRVEPVGQPSKLDPAADAARRMREAFGE